MAAHKNHPAQIGWYLTDELPIECSDEARDHYQITRDANPNHPCWEVFYIENDVSSLIARRGSYDVFGVDDYPVSDHTGQLDSPYRSTRMAVEAAQTHPVWMVPQAHNLGIYFGSGATPSRDEMHVMTWEFIAGGANGTVYYSYFDLKRDLNVTFAERWADLKAVGQEIRDAQAMLLADPAPAASWLQRTSPGMVSRAYQIGSDLYLVAVNTTRAAASATFEFDRSRAPLATLLGPTVTGDSATTLALDFQPIEVRVVRLGDNSLPSGSTWDGGYFPTIDLSGTPITRIDAAISFD